MSKIKSPALATDELLQLLIKANRPLKLDDILRYSKTIRRDKRVIRDDLLQLAEKGEIVRLRGGFYAPASLAGDVTGRFFALRSGAGFVMDDSPQKKTDDLYIHPSMTNGAEHGDLVRAVVFPGRGNGKNAEGRVLEILERPHKRIIAEMGTENSVAAQEAMVKLTHRAPGAFHPRALAEAAALPPDPRPRDWEGREDLRALPFVTIDGADARDFDDAIYVREKEGGAFCLYVAIADVSHYVLPDSAMDKEAFMRGNSWYFPGSVEPMLPEALSNGLCSLKPAVPRLAMAVKMEYDAAGRFLHSDFFPAVIQSAARLTYEQVGAFMGSEGAGETARSEGRSGAGAEAKAGAEVQAGAGGFTPDVAAMLRSAGRLSGLLGEKRRRAGALDFDLPEAEYEIDADGGLVSIKTRQRNKSHLLIENFMIAANEAVAFFLSGKRLPFLYRVHPEPDAERVEEFFRALARTGLSAPAPGEREKQEATQDLAGLAARPRNEGGGEYGEKKQPAILSAASLPEVLQAFKGTEQEFLVGRMALRSMPKALYQPRNAGHFGLALRHYCHFTSPIRRYADLMVHRVLKSALGFGGATPPTPGKLLSMAEHINDCEAHAAEAEREMLRRMAVLALYSRVGEEFSGVIAGLNDFGIFVLLDAMPVEGMIRVETMDDDYYEYDPEIQNLIGVGTGRRFGLGMKVRIRLVSVERRRLEINLELLEGGVFGRAQVRPSGAFRNAGAKNGRKAGASANGRGRNGESGKSGNGGPGKAGGGSGKSPRARDGSGGRLGGSAKRSGKGGGRRSPAGTDGGGSGGKKIVRRRKSGP